MKKITLLSCFALLASLSFAQPGNSILMNSFCVSEDFTLDYTSGSGSPVRNVYEGIGNSFNPVRVSWSTDNDRWEIWAALDALPVVYNILLYSNTYASAPNPPNKDTGTWENEVDCTDPLVTFSGNGTQSSLALAVELLSFVGKREESGILLAWTTASEYDNKGFEVERSADGQSFQKIGFLAGNGTIEKAVEYSFLDPMPLAGYNYYRLKQVDFSGRFDYSPVVVLTAAEKGTVQASPNPGTGLFFIQGLQDDDIDSVRILNYMGQEVPVHFLNGQLDLNAQPKGHYFFFAGRNVVHLLKY